MAISKFATRALPLFLYSGFFNVALGQGTVTEVIFSTVHDIRTMEYNEERQATGCPYMLPMCSAVTWSAMGSSSTSDADSTSNLGSTTVTTTATIRTTTTAGTDTGTGSSTAVTPTSSAPVFGLGGGLGGGATANAIYDPNGNGILLSTDANGERAYLTVLDGYLVDALNTSRIVYLRLASGGNRKRQSSTGAYEAATGGKSDVGPGDVGDKFTFDSQNGVGCGSGPDGSVSAGPLSTPPAVLSSVESVASVASASSASAASASSASEASASSASAASASSASEASASSASAASSSSTSSSKTTSTTKANNGTAKRTAADERRPVTITRMFA
ncbi:hypothetical protein ABW20_dc0104117 [Dactylellina cionopaga]|nr:hypothetical protein ABW20_dc0104117 [Dactylellina cionopaga]